MIRREAAGVLAPAGACAGIAPARSVYGIEDAVTFNDVLAIRARTSPEHQAFAFLADGETVGARLTYSALEREARALAATLLERCELGERVLLAFPAGLEFIPAFFACLYAGVTAVPVHPPDRQPGAHSWRDVAAACGARIALTSPPFLARFAKRAGLEAGVDATTGWDRCVLPTAAGGVEWLGVREALIHRPVPVALPAVAPDSTAFLQYTSGSTGTPRGVKVSHANLMHNASLINACFGDDARSVGVSWLPVYHDMGLIGCVLQPVYVGGSMFLMSSLAFLQRPVRWLRAITRYAATTSGGPDFAYRLCADKVRSEDLASLDLERWEVAFVGAEPVRADTLERFAHTFAPCGFSTSSFHPCYGMAETTLMVTGGGRRDPVVTMRAGARSIAGGRPAGAAPGDGTERTLVGVGRAGPGLDLRVVEPASRVACPEGEIGEIWVRGPSVAQGYWDDPGGSAETFEARFAQGARDGFLRTGDLGFLRGGELFVTGRLKDVIIVRGRNHYPHDIERTVEQADPALRPAGGAAFAVEADGAVRLTVVHEVERTHRRGLDRQRVVRQVRLAVADEHGLMVDTLVLIEPGSLPRTSSGKTRRRACRELFLDGRLPGVLD